MLETLTSWPLDTAPRDATALVTALHRGAVVALAPTPASQALVADAAGLVHEALTTPDWPTTRKVPLPYAHLGEVRQTLGDHPRFRAHLAAVCRDLGLPPATEVDAPRLRSITAGVERDPRAAPVYLMHRDTWYGCPQSLLVAWIPLHDVAAHEVFAFYPDWFDRPVPNSSDHHDHAWWMREVGWHGVTDTGNFAAPRQRPTLGTTVRWGLPAGSILMFSAAQLHQTLPNPTEGDTRFSLDFRILPSAGSEAPNVDNRSAGAAARVSAEFWPTGR